MVTHPDGLIMAQVLSFFLSFISWTEYGLQVFLGPIGTDCNMLQRALVSMYSAQ
jgi:hypothetical protein